MDERARESSRAIIKRREAIRMMGTAATGLAAGCAASQAYSAEDAHRGQGKNMEPVSKPQHYICGFHVAKANPGFQIETQHYCSMLNEDIHQCLLYDSTEKNAKLLGVEYIISDKLYRQLPKKEKKYWHAHTYEVLAGLLAAPNTPPEDEQEFMRALITTWGKTWHTWPDPKTDVPLGEPLLIWSLTGDGQADEEMIARRDRRLGVSTQELRKRRTKAYGYQVPQIDQPESLDAVGRQWTDDGPDEPRTLPE
ncbi:MAG: OBAP family protein [Planctomycetes bacterium]|nr:OBAP family protein [Planctomycetota bacterium]